jgi:hypothetical protein
MLGTVCTVFSWFVCMNEVKLLQSLFNVAEIPICFEPADISDNDIYESVDCQNFSSLEN